MVTSFHALIVKPAVTRAELVSSWVNKKLVSLFSYETQNDSERGDEQGNNHANASFNGLCTTTEPSMPWLAVQSASSSARCGVGGTGCSCALS
jgi:hypothetical protein